MAAPPPTRPFFDASPLAQLVLMRLRMFFREPSAIFWTFGFPLVLALVLGVAFRDRPPEPVRAAVERAPGADALAASLRTAPDVRAEVMDPAAATAALRTGKVAIVVIPGPPAPAYRFDPTRPESRLARLLVDDVLQRAAGRRDAATARDLPVTEPGSRYIDFLVPGLIGMNVMSSGMWGIGYVIVELRTRRLIKRMVATPMRRWHFLVSFIVMRMLFLLLELPVLLGVTRLAFGVRVQGPLPLFIGVALAGAFAFAGIGVLVASRAENTQTVAGLINVVMLPMFMLSGVFFSNANFPSVVQPLIRILPLTTLIDTLRAVANDGAGVTATALPVLALVAWGLIATATALRWFRWQ